MSDAVDTVLESIPNPAAVLDAPKSSFISNAKSFASGGFGGICAVLVGHPFDLVKVRMQTAAPGVYKGALDVVKQTIAKSGATGLYAGVGAPLAGVTPIFAVSFWGYDVGKRLVRQYHGYDEKAQLSTTDMAIAGFFSAVPMTILTAPFERVKVLLQIQGSGSEKKYNGSFDVMRKLYQEGGLRSVFRGSFATLARDGPGSAAYFATYEILKKKLTPEDAEAPPLSAIIMAGGSAGIAMWTLVFPIDTIKSQLQSGEARTLSQVCSTLYRNGGIKAFFPGIGPALLRSFPANAATFAGVEFAGRFLDTLI